MKQRILRYINSVKNPYLKSLLLILIFPVILILSGVEKVKTWNTRKIVIYSSILLAILLIPIIVYNVYYYKIIYGIIDGTPFFSDSESGINREKTEYIVIHHDDIPKMYHTRILDIDNFHRHVSYTDKVGGKLVTKQGRGWESGFAYHYYVMDTVIYHIHNNIEKTTHAPGANYNGIAICIHGDYDQEKPSRELLLRLIILIRYLQKEYDIPSDHVIGHRDVNATECPGKYLDISTLRYFLKN